MIKKLFAIGLSLIMIFTFAACNDEGENPVEEKELITEVISLEGSYTDNNESTFDYSYHLPKLNRDSADADKINEEIDIIRPLIEEQEELIKSNDTIYIFDVSWKKYENDGILSLIVSYNNLWDERNYLVFNYDLETDKRIETEELLDRIGFDKSSFETDVKKAAVRAFDESCESYFESYFDPYTMERRAFSAANVMTEGGLFYYDGEDLRGILTIGSLAGSDVMQRDVEIENEPAVMEGSPEQTNLDFVWARLTENNEVYVSFEDTKKSHQYLDNSFATYGDFKVQGCFSEYEELHIGNMDKHEFYPYLFLLTDEGHVEYVDIIKGYVNSGTLCAGGPISGLPEIESFTDGKNTVYAVSENGTKYNLKEYLEEQQTAMCPKYTGTSWAQLQNYNILLEFGENDDSMSIGIQPKDGAIEDYYTGYFSVLGITDTGVCYSYRLYDEKKGKVYCGCFEILTNGNDYEQMSMRWISGDNPFGTKEAFTATRSYG